MKSFGKIPSHTIQLLKKEKTKTAERVAIRHRAGNPITGEGAGNESGKTNFVDRRLLRIEQQNLEDSEVRPKARVIFEGEIVVKENTEENEIPEEVVRTYQPLVSEEASFVSIDKNNTDSHKEQSIHTIDDDLSSDSVDSTDDSEVEAELGFKFIPKSKRQNILEKEQLLLLEEEENEKKKALRLQKKAEASEYAKSELMRLEEEEKLEASKDDEDYLNGLDDEDGRDPEKEYEDWKSRELERMRIEQEEFELYLQEQEDLERRRLMTDDERLKEELEQGKNRFLKEKGQMKFLQKYYHKGAFFTDEYQVLQRDYTAPTLEDNFDKEALPQVLQKKNFGKRGQTKYTHLADQDTSKDAMWNSGNAKRKLGGLGDLSENNKKGRF